MAQKLKFGNGTWATKEGSTLAYNDENNNFKPLPFTTTRDSIATRVNKEGLIEVVGKDKPRIDYTDSTDGVLLLEPQSTNLVTYSEDFSNADWVKSATGIDTSIGTNGINPNAAISPDGTLNADRVNFLLQSDLDSGLFETFTASQNNSYSASVFLKGEGSNIGKKISIRVKRLSGGSFTAVDVHYTLTDKWVRLEINPLTLPTGATNGIISFTSSEATNCLIYGCQIEEASYATSYIPTNGATATRLADVCNESGNSEVFNDSEGVLFTNIAALANDGVNKFISISDGTIANRINIVFDTSNNINARQAPGSVNISTSGVNILNSNKIAYEYQNGSQELWVNGFKIGETSASTLPSGLDRLSFDSFNGGDDMYAKTKEIAYYDTALTDEELEYMTSYRSLNELVTELNLNTL